jgi:hypothetical protein
MDPFYATDLKEYVVNKHQEDKRGAASRIADSQ